MMRRFHVSAFFLLAATLVALGTNKGFTQSVSTADLRERSRPRLEAIYERGEMRAKPFRAEWLLDSSGYLVRELDEETGKAIRVVYDAASGKQRIADGNKQVGVSNHLLSPDGTKRLQEDGRSWNVLDTQSGEKRKLTAESMQPDVSYQDISWSPDGQRVLFVESDSSEVRTRNVIVPDDPSYPSVRKTRFARVGTKIPSLRIGVIEIENQQTRWSPIELPEDGGYFGQLSWAGNSDEVLVERISRFRDKREFLLAKVGGDVTSIFSETNDAWAIGSHEINSGATWIDDGKRFIFLSEKDGWRQAFSISRGGDDLRLLTPGGYDIIDRAEPNDVVDEQNGWYYFYASPSNATQRYLHRVPLDGSGTLEQVTPDNQPGWHEYQFSPDRKWAFHTYSTLNTPPVVDLVTIPEHRSIRTLEENSELRARADEVIARPAEFIQLQITKDVTVDASMIKPRDFDETKRHPVFVYVYGEPYLQTVLDRWGAAQVDFHRTIADLGYIVVSIDNRGTPSPKGAAWRRSIFGSLGPLSTEEQAAAIQELARTRSYVDLSRVGIWGWSGGGSNTLNALFRKPDVYQLGIAVVPKPQPHLYNAWFQEIYMRTPEVNADGYTRSAPIGFADGLKGKLLIMTGSGETNTHIQIIEGLVDRLIELGKPFDYMVYPNRDHGLREGKGTEVHVRMLITRYLLENLPPGPMSMSSSPQ
ncbi:S9 family peptidase [Rhodopirellula bahusiensis]